VSVTAAEVVEDEDEVVSPRNWKSEMSRSAHLLVAETAEEWRRLGFLEKRERRRGVESPTPMVTPVTTASIELVLVKTSMFS
jgi:hypothetical protein